MKRYEYQVIAAPKKGEKAKAAKTTADRFAHALTGLMNKMGADGWEYLRADTLPCDERVGLTGTKTQFQNMLVFRREMIAEAVEMLTPQPAKNAYTQIRREPKLSPIPAELFADPEPSEVEPMEDLPASAKPANVAGD
ncbi:hypothetical protein [Pseudorhodobacter ferrugineus]|uniref:hypothetical protein n=1 Tax=Pseudorhodobacter ferrugineus TaxID=77008 RepID=UPI0003B2E839|nr:hypothetical protein [Pseudorhodobacter ferrugineus]